MFKKLSLKFKILMIIVPLGLALIGASSYIILDYAKQAKQMEGLAVVADSFENFGKLITHLQTERGKSVQFLSKKIDFDDLNAHRKENTDPQIIEGKKMLTLIPFSPTANKELEDTFNTIASLRTKIDNREISIPESITAYTGLIQSLIAGEGQSAKLYSGQGIEIQLINISVVEALKEAIALTRGNYTSIFAADAPLSLSELSRVESIRAAIHVILDSSTLELMPKLHDKSHEFMTGAEWKSLEQDLDRVKEKAAKGGYGIDSKSFFSKMTTVIGNFNKILTDERTAIIKFTQDEAAKAHRTFYIILSSLIVGIAGLIGFAWLILKDLLAKEAKELVENLAAGRSFSMVENSPTSTMMCDPKGTLLYMNKSCVENLKKLQDYLPDKVENFIGKNIDMFHKNPEVQRKIISDPRNLPHKAICICGPEKLELLVTGSIDSNGKSLGIAVAWTVVTARVDLVRDLTKSASDLTSAASNVFSISSNLSAAAEETSAQANTASVASEEVNAGVQTVAHSMKEMVAAIQNITQITGEASVMATEAMSMASEANKIISQLGTSSQDIGNVIKVISSIAQQTNLLALNATIEAARAGEAGKGFAVVANEVKELAKQTAKATGEITKKIETIQADSQTAVRAINEISTAIENLSRSTGNIAAAVEEQSATTNEVTRIVTESAMGVKQINENISQVSQAATSTGKDAGSAQSAAKGVGDIAELLTGYVERLQKEA